MSAQRPVPPPDPPDSGREPFELVHPALAWQGGDGLAPYVDDLLYDEELCKRVFADKQEAFGKGFDLGRAAEARRRDTYPSPDVAFAVPPDAYDLLTVRVTAGRMDVGGDFMSSWEVSGGTRQEVDELTDQLDAVLRRHEEGEVVA